MDDDDGGARGGGGETRRGDFNTRGGATGRECPVTGFFTNNSSGRCRDGLVRHGPVPLALAGKQYHERKDPLAYIERNTPYTSLCPISVTEVEVHRHRAGSRSGSGDRRDITRTVMNHAEEKEIIVFTQSVREQVLSLPCGAPQGGSLRCQLIGQQCDLILQRLPCHRCLVAICL